MRKYADEVCEDLKQFRDYIHSIVSYYAPDDVDNGIIYNGAYTEYQIEQATRLQQHISKYTDMLQQVIGGREFEKEYFEKVVK